MSRGRNRTFITALILALVVFTLCMAATKAQSSDSISISNQTLIAGELPRLEVSLASEQKSTKAALDLQLLGTLGFFTILPVTVGLFCFYTIKLRRIRCRLNRAQEELKQAEEIFYNASEGIVVTAPDGTIVKANPTVSRISGYSNQEIIGNTPNMFASGRQPPEFYEKMWQQLLHNGFWSGELWNKRADGELYFQKQHISALQDQTGTIQNFVAVFTDVTYLNELEGELECIAHYDPLTDLPNRALLRQRLSAAIDHAKQTNRCGAVFFFDLDGFKDINDRFGHSFGDKLLSTISKRLLSQFRSTDTLARLGGDEFIGVVSDYDALEDYKSLAERVLTETRKPIDLDGKSISITTSLGIATFSADSDTTPDQLLRQSDSAMYQAKLEGKNRYRLFNPTNELEITALNNKINELSNAIDNGELEFHYQPKVDINKGQIHSTEALVRWNHPADGLRYPGSFLDATENLEVSLKLDTWALESAFKTMAGWREAGLAVPISVNIDPRNLTSNWLYDTLKRLLAEYESIDPSLFDIEVLENVNAIGNAPVATAIRQCQGLGVSFSIDDFGTGYSTLTHLRHLPAEHVKIDQSFVRTAIDSLDDLSIVDAVLGLASALSREVIAEGVETKDHQILLISLGASILQGYSIARPMPLDSFRKWAASFEPDQDWNTLQNLSKRHVKLLYLQVELRNWIKTFTGARRAEDGLPCHRSSDQLATYYWPWLNTEGGKLFGNSSHFPILLNHCEHLMNRTKWFSDKKLGEDLSCPVIAVKEMSELADICVRTIDDLLLDRDLDHSGTIPLVSMDRRS